MGYTMRAYDTSRFNSSTRGDTHNLLTDVLLKHDIQSNDLMLTDIEAVDEFLMRDSQFE